MPNYFCACIIRQILDMQFQIRELYSITYFSHHNNLFQINLNSWTSDVLIFIYPSLFWWILYFNHDENLDLKVLNSFDISQPLHFYPGLFRSKGELFALSF